MSDRSSAHAAASTRRSFLNAALLSAWGLAARRAGAAAPTRYRTGAVRVRPDLLDKTSPAGIEILQLTSDAGVPSCHVYMEAQIFTPDSRRFVLHRSATPHGSDRSDPKHQYLLCDIVDNFALHPLTTEIGATGPAVSPDGKYFYYFVDQTGPGTGPLTLKRVNLDGTDRQTLLVIDAPIRGTAFRPSKVYSLSSISSDGRKLAISATVDRSVSPIEHGLMVFDLQRAAVEVILHGPTWGNVHPQFSRSLDAVMRRDILIQENHGYRMGADGVLMPSDDSKGVDIHVVCDDGTRMRDLPWGRNGKEFCEGHQCWRGRSEWAITSVGVGASARILEGLPAPTAGHQGINTPGSHRNELTRGFQDPQFHHFATDIAGEQLITDYAKTTAEARIYLAQMGKPGEEPLNGFRCLARPRPSGIKQSHMHPFLSPDGRMAFFNSDESGVLQAYAIRGL